MDPAREKPTQLDRYGEHLEVQIFYLGCLAQASYLLIDRASGKAFAVDPRRDVEPYLEAVAAANASIAGVLETHVHADFVSGHLELSQRTGAPIFIGPAEVSFEHSGLSGGEVLEFSDSYQIRALHTPGHTTACMTYVVEDKASQAQLLAFTGDTLFIGSVGRSDLLGSVGFSQQEMADKMYHTLRDQIMKLPDHVAVYPAHGAGSPCGKGLSSDLSSTIGKEKATNPGLLKAALDDKSVFVDWTIEGQPGVPQYFLSNVEMNLEGAPQLAPQVHEVPQVPALEFQALSEVEGSVILDTRVPAETEFHIPGAVCIPVGEGWGTSITQPEDGNFALWVGTLISSKSRMLLVAPEGKEQVVLSRLGRIGYTGLVEAVLAGGAEAWRTAGLTTVSAARVQAASLPECEREVVDVRTSGEHNCKRRGRVDGAINVPLSAEFPAAIAKLDPNKSYATYCISGFRSSISASLLRQAGFDATDIVGGINQVIIDAPSKIVDKA